MKFFRVIFPSLVCLAMAACSTTHPVPYSGLASAPQMSPNRGELSSRIPYQFNSHTDWSRYTAVTVDPVLVYSGPDQQFEDVSDKDKQTLAGTMQAQFTQKLRKRFRTASGSETDALRIKLTLTGAKTSTAVLSTLSRFDLVGGPYNAVQAVRGKEGAMTGSVSFAVEIFDAKSDALLAAYVSKQYPKSWNLGATIGRLSASNVGIDKGADELIAYLQ
jgi:hypothetical protein